MDVVRFGIVGIGNMGSHHVGYMDSLPGAKLTAVCDIDPAKLKRFEGQDAVKSFGRYQDMIASGLVDAVLIATPHYFHPEIAIASFERGLHVLCEKPAAVIARDARRMNDAHAKHPNLVFSIMFQMRASPWYQKVRQLIADGELGQITRITWLITDWFRTNAYYASGGWRATWKGEGGGVLINQCPHNLDLLYWLTGLMPSRVTAVASIGKTHPIEVEDEVSAILEYDNGAIGHFVTTTGEAPGSNRLEICGDQGKIVAERGKIHFSRTRQSVRHFRETDPGMFSQPELWEIEIPHRGHNPDHKIITANFVAAIREGAPLLAPGEDGVKGLEIGNAMLMAGVTRQPVTLPMDGDAYEKLIDDLARKYGGRKTLKQGQAQADMAASFR